MADRPTELRLKELLKFYRMKDVPLDSIIDFVVEECRKTSGSELAFISFVNEDETIMDTRLWSCSTMKHCSADGRRTVFSVCDAGLWSEAVQQKMTIIVNTCPEPDPYKRGYPSGHFPIMRFMAVPVVERGRAVLIAGLANKKEPYTESDEIHISFLLEGLWSCIQRREAETQFKNESRKLSALTENAPFGLIMIENDGRLSYLNPKFTEITGYSISEVPTGKDWFRKVYPDPSYRHYVISAWLDDLANARPGEQRPRIFTVTCKDGSMKSINFISVLFEDGRNMVSIEDITYRKRAEEAVKESEDLYRRLFDLESDAIFLIDNETGRILEANNAASSLFGYDKEELVGKTNTELSAEPEKSQEVLQKELKMVPLRYHKKKDNTIFPVEITARHFTWKGRRMHLAALRDITLRRQVEDTLRESEEKYRGIFENAVMGIFRTTPEGRYLSINPAGARMYGYGSEEEMMLSITDMTHQIYVCPEERNRLKELLENTGFVEGFEVEHYTRDGGKIWVSMNARVIRDTSGNILHYETTSENITKRKCAEQALKESEEKYRSIFENAAEGIFQTTPEGRLTSLNPAMAKMHGFASSEDMLNEVSSINDQLILRSEEGKRYIKTLLKEGRVIQFETEVRHREGGIIWVSINARVVKDSEGNILGYEGTTEDITERKEAERNLEVSADKLRKSLIGTIEVISMMLEMRDPYTAGHQRRVSGLARSIAQELGLQGDVIDSIRIAGNIHDIGKMSVPAEILVKPGRLSEIEMELMKAHPRTGYDILKVVDLPAPTAEIVLQHHERLDGSGYPQGLKGEEILLEAQIMAVADVVEAMASHRPYRPSRGIEAALEEIEKNRGILYHHDVVDVCLSLFRENGFSFEQT